MPKVLNQELVLTYLKDFMDFTEELPNDLSPTISQLLELDSKIRHQIDKIERKVSKLNHSKSIRHKLHDSQKIEKYLKRIRKITEKKLKLSQKLTDLVKKKEKQLVEDYEGVLLSDQTESFTYGTRSGKIWTTLSNGCSHQ